MARPKCKTCNKQLIAHWVPIDWQDKFYNGSQPFKTKVNRWGETQGFWGEYGRDGNGWFCSLTCGHLWALGQLPNMRHPSYKYKR